jgi:hypothetical protein
MNADAFADRAMHILARLVGGARCMRLDAGDLQQTLDLLESHVAAGP